QVGGKTRFCQFCGNGFCGVFRPKRACVGCGGIMCDGCSIIMKSTASHGMPGTAHGTLGGMWDAPWDAWDGPPADAWGDWEGPPDAGDAHNQATPDNRLFHVCPGCDVRLRACPTFVHHITANQENEAGVNRQMNTSSSQTCPPTSPSSSCSTVSSAFASSSPSPVFSSIATQTFPCLVVAPSPSWEAPTSVLGANRYINNMTMRPSYTPEPRPSVSPLASLLRAIGNDNNSTSSASDHNITYTIRTSSSSTGSSSNNITDTIGTIGTSTSSTSSTRRSGNSTSSSSNNGAHQQDETFASRMDQGKTFLRKKVATIAQDVGSQRYGVMGVAAV
ncbi:unnamed protein product, partial [Ectocarpus sp. 12 AP-2014]